MSDLVAKMDLTFVVGSIAIAVLMVSVVLIGWLLTRGSKPRDHADSGVVATEPPGEDPHTATT